jgi:hypothetical protein
MRSESDNRQSMQEDASELKLLFCEVIDLPLLATKSRPNP